MSTSGARIALRPGHRVAHKRFMNFRPLLRDELDTVVEWAAREGWNPGIHDAEIFWETDPEAFWGFDVDGQLAGGGAIVSYGGKVGFMGLFIVVPELRGQGMGKKLWYFRRDHLLGRLNPGAPIAMDGVFAMQPFYAEGGFVFTHRNLRMEGIGQTAAPDPRLVPLVDLPFEEVLEFDTAHFSVPRPSFLQRWIRPEGGLALGLLTGDLLKGMGVIRPCRTGFKVGPLFAEDAQTAETLFQALSNHAAGRPIYLDTPENNPEALALANRHGLREVFGCARMVYNPPLDLPWSRIFGVTTFELG